MGLLLNDSGDDDEDVLWIEVNADVDGDEDCRGWSGWSGWSDE
jgi:hypothetical protein